MNTNTNIAKVSVIIPCYNCAKTVWRAVDSIARQTQLPAEVILIDDASNDGTLVILNEIASKYPSWIKVIAMKNNQGAGSARNVGWNVASQPYIAFLDADDAWHPEKIKVQYEWMKNNPDVGLTGHGYKVLNKVYDFNWPILSDYHVKTVKKFYSLLSNPFATRTVMLKRALPFRFKEGKRYIEDYQLWLEIILADIPAVFIKSPLAATYKEDYGTAGLSSHLWKMEKGELSAYWYVYKCRYICFISVLFLSLYSLIKYFKRVIVTSMRSNTKVL